MSWRKAREIKKKIHLNLETLMERGVLRPACIGLRKDDSGGFNREGAGLA